MCTFYILYSKTLDRFYVGHSCAELGRRLREHLYSHGGFTAKAKDWLLVYREEYTTKAEAYARERQVKSWKSRKQVEILVKRQDPADG